MDGLLWALRLPSKVYDDKWPFQPKGEYMHDSDIWIVSSYKYHLKAERTSVKFDTQYTMHGIKRKTDILWPKKYWNACSLFFSDPFQLRKPNQRNPQRLMFPPNFSLAPFFLIQPSNKLIGISNPLHLSTEPLFKTIKSPGWPFKSSASINLWLRNSRTFCGLFSTQKICEKYAHVRFPLLAS